MAENKGISRLGALLDSWALDKQWLDKLAQHELFLHWPQLVGEEIASVARPEVIREGVLWLRVVDPVWRQQLVYEKTVLLQEINARLRSRQKISDLRFRLDPALEREVAAESRAGEAPPATGPSGPQLADPQREAEFRRQLAAISDPEARDNLLRLWRKAHRR